MGVFAGYVIYWVVVSRTIGLGDFREVDDRKSAVGRPSTPRTIYIGTLHKEENCVLYFKPSFFALGRERIVGTSSSCNCVEVTAIHQHLEKPLIGAESLIRFTCINDGIGFDDRSGGISLEVVCQIAVEGKSVTEFKVAVELATSLPPMEAQFNTGLVHQGSVCCIPISTARYSEPGYGSRKLSALCKGSRMADKSSFASLIRLFAGSEHNKPQTCLFYSDRLQNNRWECVVMLDLESNDPFNTRRESHIHKSKSGVIEAVSASAAIHGSPGRSGPRTLLYL